MALLDRFNSSIGFLLLLFLTSDFISSGKTLIPPAPFPLPALVPGGRVGLGSWNKPHHPLPFALLGLLALRCCHCAPQAGGQGRRTSGLQVGEQVPSL